jgi:hypothetical protein
MEVLLSVLAVFAVFYFVVIIFKPFCLAMEAAIDRWLLWKQIKDNQRR